MTVILIARGSTNHLLQMNSEIIKLMSVRRIRKKKHLCLEEDKGQQLITGGYPKEGIATCTVLNGLVREY